MIVPAKSRRGMTLAELMVALGVVAVMIVMVVSFVMLMSGRTLASQDNLTFQQDLDMVKASVTDWMSDVAVAGQTLTPIDEPTTMITAGTDNTLYFQNNALRAGSRIIRTERITGVTFHLYKENGEYLLFCFVTRAGSDETYTFCVNPRVGGSL